jgi:hypothetical protein
VVSRDFPEEGLALLQTTIDALSAHVAVLDNERAIRVVNPAWRDFAKAGGLRDANGGLGKQLPRGLPAGGTKGSRRGRRDAPVETGNLRRRIRSEASLRL